MASPPAHRRAASYRTPTSPRGILPVRAQSGLPAATPEPSLLLMPFVRLPHAPQPPPRSPRLNPRHSRSRAGSVSMSLSERVALSQQQSPPHDVASEWIGLPLNFEIVHEQLQLEGYQLYAVEKWIVQRTRPIIVLAVYTGDPDHKITVTALAPSSSLSPHEARREWEQALHHLRGDGARPKQTPHGILMAISLAHFRSDYTIVHIPNGNYLAVKDQLYANINLLRMGCSGRTALTLEEPSDTTKERFISMYHLPEATFSYSALPLPTSSEFLPLSKATSYTSAELNVSRSRTEEKHMSTGSLSKATAVIGLGRPSITVIGPTPSNSTLSVSPTTYHEDRDKRYREKDRDKDKEKAATLGAPQAGRGKTKDRALFTATVLELVKLIQAGLAIFGLCGTHDPLSTAASIDGLLCDLTVDGIRKWIEDIGEPCAGLEPMERVADPMFVSALISLVLSIRNKLAALGFGNIVPKDPFLNPFGFTFALTVYFQSTTPANSHSPSTVASAISSSITHNQGPYTFSYPHAPVFNPGTSSSVASSQIQITSPPASPQLVVLTRELVEAIESAYDAKIRAGEGGKVRKKLKGKLDDLTNAVAGVDSDGDVERERGRGASISGGEGGGAGQVIGTLASGLGLGGGAVGGPSSVLDATVDLAGFVNTIGSKEGGGRAKRRVRDKKRESVDLGMVGLGRERDKGKDSQVAGSVRFLWTGHVADLVRLRDLERERDGQCDPSSGKKEKRLKGFGSDGDVPDPKSDGRTTEEESDAVVSAATANSFGGMWGERVQKSWDLGRGVLARKKGHTTDALPSSSTKKPGNLSVDTSKSARSSPRLAELRSSSGPQSPTLPPMVFAGEEGKEDEEDLLSSGQVSPIGEYKTNPFNVLQDSAHPSEGSSMTNLNSITSSEFAKLIKQKRTWARRQPQNRLATWADPLSARAEEDEEESAEGERSDVSQSVKGKGKQREGTQYQSMLSLTSLVDGDGVIHEEPAQMDDMDVPPPKQRAVSYASERRRSFHDLDSWRGMQLLQPDRMRIDVELCTQMLIMSRREEHLHNVAKCLEVLAVRLADKTMAMQEDYKSHLDMLNELSKRVTILSDIDAENAKMYEIKQATNTLSYESEQLRVPDLWHTASPSRAKVLSLREQVFGTGGRRLPPGVHGAHGRFNRLQWTLDGKERLVDYLGRTESEAEEESRVDPDSLFIRPPEEKEEDAVEHPNIKPMWLLRFFMGWGARWGGTSKDDGKGKVKKSEKTPPPENGSSKSVSEGEVADSTPPLETQGDEPPHEGGSGKVEEADKSSVASP